MDDAQSTTTPLNSIKIKKKGKDNFGFVGAAEELGMVERVSHNSDKYCEFFYLQNCSGSRQLDGKQIISN